VGTVGIIVNPWAGKDVRRLHAPVGHTPDTAKIGIVRRVAVGALESGVTQVLAARDVGRIAERAIRGLDGAALVDGPGTGSALDTRRAAAQFSELGCDVVVVLGGDGTCRDVAMGWSDVTMIALSTGTNNVFPRFVDGSSAGTAAGMISTRSVDVRAVARRAKRLSIEITRADRSPEHDIALVDVALIDAPRTGARAVVKPGSIRAVVAAIATPTSTGLSSIAGRVHPLGRNDDGAIHVVLGGRGRHVRVPLVPGSFDVLSIDRIELLPIGASVRFDGPGVVAYDGERDRVLPEGASATITVDRLGPSIVDVDRTLHCAAIQRLFDLPTPPEAPHGD
jgi:hypothetical protein